LNVAVSPRPANLLSMALTSAALALSLAVPASARDVLVLSGVVAIRPMVDTVEVLADVDDDGFADHVFVLQTQSGTDTSALHRDFKNAQVLFTRSSVVVTDAYSATTLEFYVGRNRVVGSTPTIEVEGTGLSHRQQPLTANANDVGRRSLRAQTTACPPTCPTPEPDPGSGGGGSSCKSGGPGSSSCSVTCPGAGCEVTCAEGYYACCNCYVGGCSCKKNGT
jgi:hypothetical protein